MRSQIRTIRMAVLVLAAYAAGTRPGAVQGGGFDCEPLSAVADVQSAAAAKADTAAPAGSLGRLGRQGESFVFEQAKDPVTFRCVFVPTPVLRQPKAELHALAARLAAAGVNLVRFDLGEFTECDPAVFADPVHDLMATLKQRGIYSYFRWTCPSRGGVDRAWGWEGFEPGEDLAGLQYFYPPLQHRHRQWAQAFFGRPNPHTGLSLANDPAVVCLELEGKPIESAVTAFDPSHINPRAMPWLQREFGDWAKQRYGSLAKALETWGEARTEGQGADDVASGRLALASMAATPARDAPAGKRAADQREYMRVDIRAFYADIRAWFKSALGYDGLFIDPTSK